MNATNLHRVMHAPIACRGDSCRQGRKQCASPLKCSGSEFIADASVARIKKSIPLPVTFAGSEPEGPGLLASREFWGIGMACLAIWAVVGALAGRFCGWW